MDDAQGRVKIPLPPDWPVGERHPCVQPDGHVANHQFMAYDHEKADRFMERLYELGAATVYVSPDLTHMLVKRPHTSAHSNGFNLICDDKLPPNSVVDVLARRFEMNGRNAEVVMGIDYGVGRDQTVVRRR
jgi:hypothetical protein